MRTYFYQCKYLKTTFPADLYVGKYTLLSMHSVRHGIILLFILLALPAYTFAQSPATESIIGGQIGFLGGWAYAEYPIGSKSVIRGELGLDGGIWAGSFRNNTVLALAPVATLSPRYYYNLSKRSDRGKRVAGNAANFISLRTKFHPGWFTLSNTEGLATDSGITVLPTWGIRRTIGRRFNYEVGFGLGYTHRWDQGRTRESSVTAGLHLRVGL